MKHTVSEVKLKNGAKGLFIDVPGATVTSYELVFRAGEYLVPEKKVEVPHLMEHMVWGGANEAFPDRKVFQAEVGKNGAYSNAFTSYYSVGYVGEMADFEWERVMRLQWNALSKPLFLQQEFDAEFGNIRDELTSYNNEYFRVVSSHLNRSFGFRGSPDKERVKLMDNVKRDDLVEHYKRTHYTRNMRFIVAGSLRGRRNDIKNVLESLDLPEGPARLKLPIEKATKPAKPVFVANDSIENIYMIISSRFNEIISPRDDEALQLARIMLTDTLYSKIFGQARDRGLVYHVSSSHHIASQNSEWELWSQVLPANASTLCDIVLREVKKVQNGIIDDDSFEAAKQYALGSFQRSMQTVGSIGGAYGRYFFDGYIEDVKTIPDRIKAVTKQDMAKAMRKMFSEGLGNVGVLGGKDSAAAQKLYEQLEPLWRLSD